MRGLFKGALRLAVALAVLCPNEMTAEGIEALPTQERTTKDQVYGDYVYARPKLLTFIKQIPGDVVDFGKGAFSRENAVPTTLVIGSTALLIWGDQWLLDKAYQAGHSLGISHTNRQKTLLSTTVPGVNYKLYFQGPYDSGSALYFIGDGWTSLYVAGGFLVTGTITKSNRALQTSSQIAESVLASGAVVQVLKHITGRESPYVRTRDGGRWVPFPNQVDYAKNVPKYDAYPSGHVAASMSAVTVVAENYPRAWFVRPLGYTLVGLLGFQMMNNGVHWASDYPLSIALGYGFGKIAVRKGRRPKQAGGNHLLLLPLPLQDGYGMLAQWRFRSD